MGAWIETHDGPSLTDEQSSRTLTWVRGLKRHLFRHSEHSFRSHPYMGAWIETLYTLIQSGWIWSHPYMGAWIETYLGVYLS